MKTEIQIESEIQEIVPLFLSSRKEDILHIQAHLDKNNFDEIKKIAHTIKGISRPYGFPSLEALSRRLEDSAIQKSSQEVAKILLEIQSYISKYTS